MNNLIADLLNGFSLKDIPLFLIQITAAAFLGLILSWITKSGSHYPLLASTVALMTVLVKNSIPLAILMAAVIIPFTYKRIQDNSVAAGSDYVAIAAIVAGIGCGSGSVILTACAFVFVIIPVIYFAGKK